MTTVLDSSYTGSGGIVDQLSIYNGALLLLGERALASLSENREPRRLLDQVWASNGVRACLEQGQWGFAMRTLEIDYDPSVEPDFGYTRAFSKPDDWVLTAGLCSDEFFTEPLLQYTDEAGYWYAELDTLYVRYVSDADTYGRDYAGWPETFREFVEAHFAMKIAFALTSSEDTLKRISTWREKKLKDAKSKAAMAEPTAFPARGAWVRARRTNSQYREGGDL